MKVIVDTDPGIDDAIALSMLLSRKSYVNILGITCVSGNCGVEQSVINTLKILDAFDRKDVPVFKGASSAILCSEHTAQHYHGEDGLGDVHHDTPDNTPLQTEHAVSAINRLVQDNKGEVTVIALGPLTNIALALRMNPGLAHDIKELVIMGGNYKGQGNVTMGAEFNFFIDPVAAHVVIEEFKCPKYLITWELSKEPYFDGTHHKEYSSRGNKRSDFFKKIFDARGFYEAPCGICDAVAVAVALDRNLITKKHEVYGTVVLHGVHTKGLLLIDWTPQYRMIGEFKENNLIIVDEIDVQAYTKLLLESTE